MDDWVLFFIMGGISFVGLFGVRFFIRQMMSNNENGGGNRPENANAQVPVGRGQGRAVVAGNRRAAGVRNRRGVGRRGGAGESIILEAV